MPAAKHSQFISLLIILGAVAIMMTIDPPFFVRLTFVLVCIAYSAWCFVTVFRGPDEVQSAAARYALAFASGTGVPLALIFVMIMTATPNLQIAIATLAGNSRSDLLPAAAGFGLGAVFTMGLLTAAFATGLGIWWASKR